MIRVDYQGHIPLGYATSQAFAMRRNQAGDLMAYTMRYVGSRIPPTLIEYRVPSPGSAAVPTGKSWTDIWGGRLDCVFDGTMFGLIGMGFVGDELWTTFGSDYPSGPAQHTNLGPMGRTLNPDGTISNLRGPYGLQKRTNRVYCGSVSAPPSWLRAICGDPVCFLGGGYYSLFTSGTSSVAMGPTCLTADPSKADAAGQLDFLQVLDYTASQVGINRRGRRVPDVDNTIEPQWQSPAPDGVGWLAWNDRYSAALAFGQGGLWAALSRVTGRVRYWNSTVQYDGGGFELQFYPTMSLILNARGLRKPWGSDPSYRLDLSNQIRSLGLGLLPQGMCFETCTGRIIGMAYDNGLLYLLYSGPWVGGKLKPPGLLVYRVSVDDTWWGPYLTEGEMAELPTTLLQLGQTAQDSKDTAESKDGVATTSEGLAAQAATKAATDRSAAVAAHVVADHDADAFIDAAKAYFGRP